ncbi:UHRF1-binding protein 1-like [Schistosoma japonicum]|nr:UHRF1-binding protein 1-like [Schistosoma japonicum]
MMSSVLKSKILKPFLKFTKNLSSNKLHMSLLKGILELEALELEENALMELLDLPTWLLLRKAHCTNVVAKSIDHISIELQALDEPRLASDSPVANYRNGSGKYGFSDKVIDGVTIQVNSVFIKFFAQAFQDGALISSRIRLLLDDLLWVFTLSQVEAAIVFARSLEHSIRLASEQSKRFAADKAMRQTVTMSSSSKTQSLVNNNNSANCTSNNHTQSTVTAQNSATKRTEDYVNAVNLFHQYDVLETSYHLTISRTELHFCDETKEKIQLNPNIVPNGSIRVNLTTLSIDWYPYHLDILSELPWPGCREFHSARDNWLKGINPIHFTNGRLFSTNSSTVTDNQFVILDCGLLQTMNTSVLQSVGILRLVDITVSCVSYPKSLLKPDNSSTLFLKSSQNHKTFFSTCAANNARIQTEIPVDRNLFIGSDKLLHNLPDASPFLTVELRNHYSVDDTSSGYTNFNALPCLLFCQVNPFYINFDPDTVIWLNIFLLTLQLNLSTFLLRKNKCSLKQPNRLFDLNRYHVRFEALMPRLIFSLFDRYNRDANLSKWIGPHALVIQKLLDNLQSNCSHFGANFVNTSPFNSKSVPHKSPDILMFQKLIESATELHSLLPNFDEQFWCIHCPNVWSEFLTVIDVLHPPNHPVNNDRINSSTIYRQSLIESFPLTVWSLVPINIPVSTTANNNDHQSNNSPISLIIDIDNKLNPMDSSSLSSPHVINQSIKFSLGSVDQLSTNRILLPHIIKFCITDHEKLKIPDALDQIIFMYHIYQQISYVQSHLCLNYQEFAEITKSRFTSSINPQSNHNAYHQLFYCAESPILSGGKLNKTIFRQSISGRIHSTDDSPRSLVLRNDSDRCIGTADKNDGSKRSNKLLYSSSPSPKAFLTKYQTNSSISSINRKVCNSTCRDKPLQNKPFSEQNIFALNPVVNDTWTNNSSTNNISEQFSISSDLSDLQGISNSIDDWTEPFEVLSKLRSSSTNENNDILCSPRDHIIDNQYGHFHSSLNHQQCNHLRNSSSFLLGPDEIGSELLDNFSTCTSNPTETTKPVTVEMCKHSEPERNDTDQEKFRLWKISNISSVIINLTGFSCEAETFDCSITSSSCYHFGQQQNDDFVQSDYLWSIFLSFGGDPTVGLIKLNPANDNYPWLCINAILLRNWQVWHQINIHKGIDQLNGGNSSIHNNNNSPNTSPPKRSIRLLLKQGSLTLKLASNTKEDLEQLKLFKELFLQQGLIIELTKNGIFQITSDQCTMNIEEFSTTGSTSDDHYLHDNKSLSSYTAINPSNTFHNILINRYASENKLLKDKIDALTIELMKYKLLHND